MKSLSTRETVEQFAERLSDAYSTDRYKGGWAPSIRMLRRRGYNDVQIESIIRSKWTRWAADSASTNSAGPAVLAKFLDTYRDDALKMQVAELVAETFPGLETA